MMFMFNYGTLIDPLFRDLRKYTPEFAGIKAGDRVIDVCCGTGAQVLEYGRRGVDATGIDISRGMLKIAEKNLWRENSVNVLFRVADATSLPFKDGFFDYASISLGLHDKEKTVRYQIISEMKRVIKQDGALILIDYQVPLPRHAWAVSARTVEYLAGGSHYQSFKDYLATGGLEDILKNNGLREERRTTFKSGLLVVIKAVIGIKE
jgi:ubiquinone/menaquinone biosynthesis C-methylase UbiE